MTHVNERVAALMRVLTESGFGWLASEVGAALGASTSDEAAADEVTYVRKLVSAGVDFTVDAPGEDEAEEPLNFPQSGDQQVQFATDYVLEQLSAYIEMARLSVDILAEIADNNHEFGGITMLLDDGPEILSGDSIESATQAVHLLRERLISWRSEGLNGGDV